MQLFEVHTDFAVVWVGVNVAEIVAVGVGEPEIVGVIVAEGVAVMLTVGVGTIVADNEAEGVMLVGIIVPDGAGVGDSSSSPPGRVVNVQKDPPLLYVWSPILI